MSTARSLDRDEVFSDPAVDPRWNKTYTAYNLALDSLIGNFSIFVDDHGNATPTLELFPSGLQYAAVGGPGVVPAPTVALNGNYDAATGAFQYNGVYQTAPNARAVTISGQLTDAMTGDDFNLYVGNYEYEPAFNDWPQYIPTVDGPPNLASFAVPYSATNAYTYQSQIITDGNAAPVTVIFIQMPGSIVQTQPYANGQDDTFNGVPCVQHQVIDRYGNLSGYEYVSGDNVSANLLGSEVIEPKNGAVIERKVYQSPISGYSGVLQGGNQSSDAQYTDYSVDPAGVATAGTTYSVRFLMAFTNVERITVPAGTFDVAVAQYVFSGHPSPATVYDDDLEGESTVYLAAGVGIVQRITSISYLTTDPAKSGYQYDETSVLLSARVGG